MIGLSLGITRGGGVPFSPASLFANGEDGVWFEPSPATCFTDTAGTTPAAVGDPVARINDLSGNGNHATQATEADRPILRLSGGLYYLELDGTNDVLVTSTLALSGASPSHVIAGVLIRSTPSTNGGLLNYGTGTTNTSRALGFGNSVLTKADAGSNSAPGVDFTWTNRNVFEARFGPSVDSAVNGGDFTQSESPTNTTAGTYKIGQGITGSFMEYDAFSIVAVHRALTDIERGSLVGYVANKAGVAL